MEPFPRDPREGGEWVDGLFRVDRREREVPQTIGIHNSIRSSVRGGSCSERHTALHHVTA